MAAVRPRGTTGKERGPLPLVEVADLEQDPAGFFGCMIERFAKSPARVGPTAGQKDRFTLRSPMPGEVIVSAVAVTLDRTVKIRAIFRSDSASDVNSRIQRASKPPPSKHDFCR